MVLRRGFKSEANWYAREMRRELRLPVYSPLCPWKLADHLGFPVTALTTYTAIAPDTVAYFLSPAGQKEFSATTIFDGPRRQIIYNDGHTPKRQAADIAHELAHGLLLHPPKPPLDAGGCRHYDKALEKEAEWLGPALLISDEAAIHIVKRRLTLQTASDLYGVSVDLVRMRLNVSGAAIRVARRRVA